MKDEKLKKQATINVLKNLNLISEKWQDTQVLIEAEYQRLKLEQEKTLTSL